MCDLRQINENRARVKYMLGFSCDEMAEICSTDRRKYAIGPIKQCAVQALVELCELLDILEQSMSQDELRVWLGTPGLTGVTPRERAKRSGGRLVLRTCIRSKTFIPAAKQVAAAMS